MWLYNLTFWISTKLVVDIYGRDKIQTFTTGWSFWGKYSSSTMEIDCAIYAKLIITNANVEIGKFQWDLQNYYIKYILKYYLLICIKHIFLFALDSHINAKFNRYIYQI